MQDKTASTPDVELVGHTDTAAFALGMCTSEPLVASGGKDTNVSCHHIHAMRCVCFLLSYARASVVSCYKACSIVSNSGLTSHGNLSTESACELQHLGA